MDDIKHKRIQLLAQIDRLNRERCPKCEGVRYSTGNCCKANIEIRKLGKQLDGLRSPNAKEFQMQTYEGQYKLWKKVAIENGISADVYRQRVTAHGFTFERAATQPVAQLSPKVVSDELMKIAKANGLTYSIVKYRIQSGWAVEEAIRTPNLHAGRKVR